MVSGGGATARPTCFTGQLQRSLVNGDSQSETREYEAFIHTGRDRRRRKPQAMFAVRLVRSRRVIRFFVLISLECFVELAALAHLLIAARPRGGGGLGAQYVQAPHSAGWLHV